MRSRRTTTCRTSTRTSTSPSSCSRPSPVRSTLVVVSGPIASGKSTLGRAVAHALGGAVVDLDLVYEMLDPGRGVKDDARLWRAARRSAGAIAGLLLADGRDVVLEGDFRTAAKRAELAIGLPDGVEPCWVTLRVGFEEALRRAQADPTRGLSRDPAILRAHYDEDEPGLPDDLVLDTERLSLEGCVRAVVRQPAAS